MYVANTVKIDVNMQMKDAEFKFIGSLDKKYTFLSFSDQALLWH